MHYVIYKTTNLINGKFYIGKHQTKDINDGYVGSGKLLKHAIKKYGLDQFKTEILEMCPTEAHMNLAEKIYVVVDREVSYNLCPGGKGGFGYINSALKGKISAQKSERMKSKPRDYFVNIARMGAAQNSERLRRAHASGLIKPPNHTGRKRSSVTKHNISSAMQGKQTGILNSQHGTCWINNGNINKKIKKEQLEKWIEQGYNIGRLKWTEKLFGMKSN